MEVERFQIRRSRTSKLRILVLDRYYRNHTKLDYWFCVDQSMTIHVVNGDILRKFKLLASNYKFKKYTTIDKIAVKLAEYRG